MIAWLERRIPAVSAEAAAIFRIVFGALLLAFFLTHRVDAGWIERAAPESPFHRVALPMLERAPQLAEWIALWITSWGVLFIAGAMTRLSFAMMAVGAILWSLVYTMRVGAHAVEVLVLAMVCLLVSRWSVAWSVDAWWHGRRADPTPNRAYGYSIWILGLVLGTSLAAAAFAKIRLGGVGWITNGTVKYHFLTDSPDAPVDWGLRLAQYDSLAIALSFAAITIEALVLVGAFSARYRYRLAAGIAALSLLAGFALFQGLFWPAWWVLLLAFLPWHLVRLKPDTTYDEKEVRLKPYATYERSTWRPALAGPGHPARPPRTGQLRPAQTLVIAVLLLQQAVASLERIEFAPLISAFDMYSSTYSSPADYEAKAGMSYWIAAQFADGKSTSCRVSREDADAVLNGEGGRRARVLENCFDTAAPTVRAVSIEGSRRAVDWARWRLGSEVRVTLAGPIAVVDGR